MVTVERVTARAGEAAQRRAAAALRARGLHTGDRVAVIAASSGQYLAVVLGALRSGVVPVLLDPTLTAAERQDLLDDADPRLVLGDDDLGGLVGDGGPEAELADAPLARAMLYTSGTTGRPRAVWTGVLPEAQARAALADERDVWGFDRDDVALTVSGLHHSAPLRFATGVLMAGGDVVLAAPFDAAGVSGVIERERPTVAFMVPAHLQRLLALPAPPDLSCFRVLAHAGAPCSEPLKRSALDAFPSGSVWEFYGSTEGQFTACSPDEWLARPGTVGRARPGRRLEIDADGLVWCHAPAHARFEYWRDPERTASAWRGDSFTVGDVGRLDEQGYLFLDGRRDDLIISGGMNVYPLEVEQVLRSHVAVDDAVVFPVPDEHWGQMVCAAVVGDVDLDDLERLVRTRLAPHKRPKQVLLVPEIPVDAGMGKVRRWELAERLGF